MIKVASWNVNSLNVRLEQVLSWLETSNTDVLALQETKLIDEHFPKEVFHERGYYITYSGQKTYNGVAIISKHPISDVVTDIPMLDDPQRRILAVTIEGLRIINLYVPNGAAVGTDKYHYKLDWLSKLHVYIEQELVTHPNMLIMGDFNIAPEDCDVHDPAEWEGCVLVSPPERLALSNVLALGLADSFRLFNQVEQSFSWWDYRAAGFRRNRGLRIDLILVSDALKSHCIESSIDKTPRASERPSDHAPVWAVISGFNA